jgi:Family of unknown function (DUF6212)
MVYRIFTDPASSRGFFNGDFKVILPIVDLPSATEVLRLPSTVVPYFCARGHRGQYFEISNTAPKPGPLRVPLDHPPTFCLALLATSTTGKKELEALQKAWSGGGGGFLPDPVLIGLADGPEAAALQAHRLLFDAVARVASSSASRLFGLQRQYTAFRIVHDQLQNAFDTVENFLSRSQLPPTWLAFACDPTNVSVGPEHENKPCRVTQLLPLPSQGLAAVELHALSAGPDADGMLTVSLVTGEDSRILGEWAIPYKSVPTGWMFLDLPDIDIRPKQSVMLTATWKTRTGCPPQLSLTQLQPLPETRIQISGGEPGTRSLALRLHIGLPGSRRVTHPFQIGVKRQSRAGSIGRRLAPGVLRGCAEVEAPASNEPLVRFLEGRAAIEVRPVNGSVTIAKLPAALPAWVTRLTATIKTEDATGALVEYALLALDPERSHKPILKDGLADNEGSAFSGWLPIEAELATQIHVNLTKPAARPLDLYLATRLAKGQVAETANARWLEFVVNTAADEPLRT